MKILKIRRKHLKFIFALVILNLFFSSSVMALWEPPPAPAPVSPSAIGGAFSSLMSESFRTDLATGVATMSIPIVIPPGRKNVQPNIALSYSSNNPDGVCGVGWFIPVSAIQRSTKEGVPRYNSVDDFVAGGEELVKIAENGDEYEYRAKIESSFTKYVYSTTDKTWIVYDKAGTQYHFGLTDASRMLHPEYPDYIFAWYIDKVVDVYGNAMTYIYEKHDNSVYLKYIDYTSNPAHSLNADKRIEFDYEFAVRPDNIYNNRAGWTSIMTGRLHRIIIRLNGEVVWIYNLNYVESSDTSRSLLESIQLEDGEGNTLPAKAFTYQSLD